VQTSLNTFDQLCKITINWVHAVPLLSHIGSILARLEAIRGFLFGHFLRAESVIFSAKKLGLKRPMLDSCWAMCFSETASAQTMSTN